MDLKFEFSIAEANLILSALTDRPYKEVHGLILKLQSQAQPQLQVAEPATEKPEKEKN
jgi:hypothetical protein